MSKIKIAINGYGNLGRGVELAIRQNPDMELTAVFTRRNPEDVKILTPTAKVYHIDDVEKYKDSIDVMILCGGSATDLPQSRDLQWQSFSTQSTASTLTQKSPNISI